MNAREYLSTLNEKHEELDGKSTLEFYAGHIRHFYFDTLDAIFDEYITEITEEQVKWNAVGGGVDITFDDDSTLIIRQTKGGALTAYALLPVGRAYLAAH